MESVFKSVVSTLSFLFLVFFCFFSDIVVDHRSNIPTTSTPSIESVGMKFEQVPAVVNIEGDQYENQFDWQIKKRYR